MRVPILFALALCSRAVVAATTDEDDLEIEAPAAPAAAAAARPPAPTSLPAPAATSPATAPLDALRVELADLHERLARLESAPAAAPTPPSLRLSGFVQLQYMRSELSQDQLRPGGESLNLDRFEVRRGRIRLSGDWDAAGLVLELDANTHDGASVGVRRAEASLSWRRPDAAAPPYVKGLFGLTRVPFGSELAQSEAAELLFLERSTASRAFFPGAQDVGVAATGGLGPFRYALGAFGGAPTSNGVGVPLTRRPTLVGRVGASHAVPARYEAGGGVSFLSGAGLSRGTDATKGHLAWRDLNENGVVDDGEVEGVAAATARPSATFDRWAVNADAWLRLRTPAGWTRLFAEATMASNLDRGLFAADPVLAGRDIRESGWVAGLLHELSPRLVVGVRADAYDPDADFLDARRGRAFVTDQTLTTVSPMVAVLWPGRGRFVVQYDHQRDRLARGSDGLLTDLANDAWTARLQGEF